MLLNQFDELQDSMDRLVGEGKKGEAAQDALEFVQLLQRISNSSDALDAAHAHMTVKYLFGDAGREERRANGE